MKTCLEILDIAVGIFCEYFSVTAKHSSRGIVQKRI